MKTSEGYIVTSLHRYAVPILDCIRSIPIFLTAASRLFRPCRSPQSLHSRIAIFTFVLGALTISATSDASVLQEVGTPETGDDFITLVKPDGGAVKGRKIRIGTLVPKRSDAGLTNDVWITVRTDGKTGDGSQRNPFDGSTQAKLDAILAGIRARSIHIHLGPGTFKTHGAMAWMPQEGWHITGAGMWLTTVQQTAIQDGQFQVIGLNGNVSSNGVRNLVVENLTVDCNYPTLSAGFTSSNKAIGAVGAQSGRISNVRAINSGGTGETFTLSLTRHFGPNSSSPTISIIENCRVEQVGSNVSAIAISSSAVVNNGDTVPDGQQAIIKNSYVEGTGGSGVTQAFLVSGYKNTLIDGNFCKGVTNGFYADTLPQGEFKIVNNYLSAAGQAIAVLGSYTIDYVLVEGNTLETTSDLAPSVHVDSATRTKIVGNRFLGLTTRTFWPAIQTNGTSGSNDIQSNLFPVGSANGSGRRVVGRLWNNRAFDGSTIPWLADNYIARSAAVVFANLPSNPMEGMMISVSDSATNTWGATITGGGTNHVLGYYDGTNWTVMAK